MSADEGKQSNIDDDGGERKTEKKCDVQEDKKITVHRLDDVKPHKTCKSLWLVIENKVYDVTDFMEEHPGGEEVLLDLGGTDATEPFEDVSHSSDAREMMQKYCIGDLHDDDKTKRSKPNTTTEEETFSPSTWTNWLVPLGLALAAALLYRYMMVTKDVS